MSKKIKRYDGEDGSVVETDTAQGQNTNIGDDVRARAMAAMANRESEPAPTPTKKAVGKAITKAAATEKAEEKKPYIDIPKRAAGVQQFRSDAESPAGRLFKNLMNAKSQRTTAAEKKMKAGGKVSSASSRADGIASKGKTRGKIC